MMFNAVIGKLGMTELLVILAIILVLFGPTQLPKLSKTLGKTISGFKKGIEEELDKEDAGEAKSESGKENSAE